MFDRLSYISAGEGPPLAVLLYLPEATEPRGVSRGSILRMVRPLTERFTVYILNRPPGLPQSTTMADLAGAYAAGMKAGFGGPVHVLGLSTGGVIAQQLAADHPGVVDRVVLAGTAYRLGPIGRRAQESFVQRARAGRRPSPPLAEVVTGSAFGQRMLAAVMWLADGRKDFTDAAAMIAAENAADLSGRLGEISAPVLLIQGSEDRAYPLELARRTVEGIPDARLIVYDGVGHGKTFTDKRFTRDILAFLSGDPTS